MNQYKPLPESGIVPLGFYTTKYGRVWVTKKEIEESAWVYDTKTMGYYKDRYQTEMEGCNGVYPSLVTVDAILRAFEERNLERRINDR